MVVVVAAAEVLHWEAREDLGVIQWELRAALLRSSKHLMVVM